MKERQNERRQWNDQDEDEFVQRLQHELEKVSHFQEEKVRHRARSSPFFGFY
jgi:SPX domain protein involved in polyphosphate accumulation